MMSLKISDLTVLLLLNLSPLVKGLNRFMFTHSLLISILNVTKFLNNDSVSIYNHSRRLIFLKFHFYFVNDYF